MERELAQELIKKVLPSYQIKEVLGEGSFGSVFRIGDALKERAVKIIPLSASPSINKGSLTSATQKIERDFRHIVESYEKIACDEIVTIYDFFKITGRNESNIATAYALVLMELYPSNLYDYVIGKFRKTQQLLDIPTIHSIMEKLAFLLEILFVKRGFLFEDLKPENILIREQEDEVKIVVGDIGGLKSVGSISTTGSQVTLSYCAPEILRKGQKPDQRALVYSYGLISCFLLEGRLPYENYGVTERIDRIKDTGIAFERKDIPEYLKNIIEKCLSFEPENRYVDFGEILSEIQSKAKASGRDVFSEETIDLDTFRKQPPVIAVQARQNFELSRRSITPGNIPKGLKASVGFRSVQAAKKRTGTTGSPQEIKPPEKIGQEIKELSVKSGDMFRLQNDNFKISADIYVESGGMLIIENAGLFFDEKAGIISHGSIRAKNSSFSPLAFSGKWKNILICPADTRINTFERCKFSSCSGRTWGEIKASAHIQSPYMNETYSYGGAFFISEVRERIVQISDCHFMKCSAHEGAGIFCIKAHPGLDNCIFEFCTAALVGGGISAVESNPSLRACIMNNCSAHKDGGGINCVSSAASIENSAFNVCSTRYLYGGGIYCTASSPVIKGCKFNRCSAGKDGGGIYFDEASAPKILYPAFSECRPNNTNQDKSIGQGHYYFK